MISKIKSILNYYQIDLGGIKSEKMTKNKKKEFLDRFNANYDAYTVLDILDKIKERFPDKLMENPEDEMGMNEDMGDMEDIFGNLDDHIHDDDAETENEINPFDKKQSKDIDEFINWISSVLYSANHKVIITKDGLTTNIKLVKIKGGKKK
jgi:hypothetical protein